MALSFSGLGLHHDDGAFFDGFPPDFFTQLLNILVDSQYNSGLCVAAIGDFGVLSVNPLPTPSNS